MLGLYLLLWCGLQVMQTVALFYLVQVIQLPANISTWVLLLFQVSALAGLQRWSIYSNNHGRVEALVKGGILWISGCLGGMFLPPLSTNFNLSNLLNNSDLDLIKFGALLIIILISGFGGSTAYLIPWSLLPDAIDQDPDRPAGSYTAWMVLIQKVLVAVSVFSVTLLLWVAGYQATPECTGALTFSTQPKTALLTIRLFMGLIPAILVALGIKIMGDWDEKDNSLALKNI